MNSSSKRILIPTVDYPPIEGGIGTVARELARELAAMGHEVTVVAPRLAGIGTFDEEEPVRVVRFGGYRWGRLRILHLMWAAWPLLRETDLVVAVNVSYGGLIGWLARKRFGLPYVVLAYAYEFLKYSKHSLRAALLRRIYARAERTVAISRFTRDQLEAFGAEPARISLVMPGARCNGTVEPEVLEEVRRKYIVDTKHMILAVGRLVARKGHETLVQALPGILERYPDALLVLVGQGPRMSATLKLAGRLGVRQNLLVPGRLPDADIAALYELCEVFALPTEEGREGRWRGLGWFFSRPMPMASRWWPGGRAGWSMRLSTKKPVCWLSPPIPRPLPRPSSG